MRDTNSARTAEHAASAPARPWSRGRRCQLPPFARSLGGHHRAGGRQASPTHGSSAAGWSRRAGEGDQAEACSRVVAVKRAWRDWRRFVGLALVALLALVVLAGQPLALRIDDHCAGRVPCEETAAVVATSGAPSPAAPTVACMHDWRCAGGAAGAGGVVLVVLAAASVLLLVGPGRALRRAPAARGRSRLLGSDLFRPPRLA